MLPILPFVLLFLPPLFIYVFVSLCYFLNSELMSCSCSLLSPPPPLAPSVLSATSWSRSPALCRCFLMPPPRGCVHLCCTRARQVRTPKPFKRESSLSPCPVVLIGAAGMQLSKEEAVLRAENARLRAQLPPEKVREAASRSQLTRMPE